METPNIHDEIDELSLGGTGRVDARDNPEIVFAVGRDKDNVILDFGKALGWVSLPSEIAKNLGRRLISHALALEDARALHRERSNHPTD